MCQSIMTYIILTVMLIMVAIDAAWAELSYGGQIVKFM